jgi:hypothetical protein
VAPTTLLGFEDDHLIHVFHRPEGTRMTRMARLPSTTALPLRATSTGRLWRIARRRTGGVTGSLVEPLL